LDIITIIPQRLKRQLEWLGKKMIRKNERWRQSNKLARGGLYDEKALYNGKNLEKLPWQV